MREARRVRNDCSPSTDQRFGTAAHGPTVERFQTRRLSLMNWGWFRLMFRREYDCRLSSSWLGSMEHRRLICGDEGSESTDDQDGESSNHLESKELENVHEGWISEAEPYRMYPDSKDQWVRKRIRSGQIVPSGSNLRVRHPVAILEDIIE